MIQTLNTKQMNELVKNTLNVKTLSITTEIITQQPGCKDYEHYFPGECIEISFVTVQPSTTEQTKELLRVFAAGLTGKELPPLKVNKYATEKELTNLLSNSGYSKDELMNIVNEIK